MATNGVGITSLLRSSNHVLDERKRQLQDNNENPITFQLKMYWQVRPGMHVEHCHSEIDTNFVIVRSRCRKGTFGKRNHLNESGAFNAMTALKARNSRFIHAMMISDNVSFTKKFPVP